MAGTFKEPWDPPMEGSSEVEAPGPARSPGDDLSKRVEENLPWLEGWLRGRIRDPEIVHDVCQESFLKALRSASLLKDPAKFPAWLYRIAQNTLRDHLRRRTRTRKRLLFTGDPEVLEVPAADKDEVELEDETQRLLVAVRALPPRYRDPLLLLYSRDSSYAEIGRILGLSENAVRVRIFRARKLLKRELGEGLDGHHEKRHEKQS